jgi:ribonucleoside-diphosphate reductase alpha chain
LTYKRKRRFSNSDAKFDFIDSNGDKWIEYSVFHPKFKTYLELNNINLNDENYDDVVKNSPYYNSESHYINYESKIELQARLNKFIDHSISVTINLPSSITKEKVSELYIKAHELGCKGLTIYVDGSREGVLTSNKQKEIKQNINIITERPKEIVCDIHHVQAIGKKWYVIIGLIDERPVEVFTLLEKNVDIPSGKKSGKLIKIKSGIYDLKINGTTLKDISNFFEFPEDETDTRLISLLLKANIPILKICEQLEKSKGVITSLAKAVARTLRKNYMTDEEIIEMNGKKCPECGGKLEIKEGCAICIDCGHSKC